MRFLTGLLLVLISNISTAQDNAFVNTWGKGSRVIYLGVNNELKPIENSRIISASSREATVNISADSTSLIVKPRMIGPVTITLEREKDSIIIVYQSASLPFPQLSIGDGGFNVPTVTTEQLVNATGLKVKGSGKESFFDECILSCCELQIGNDFYSFSGELFTDEIKDAFSRLTEGDKVIVKRMILEVKSTGKTIKMDPATSFTLKN
jgi:hypothetical protein